MVATCGQSEVGSCGTISHDTGFEDPSSKYLSDPDRSFSKCLAFIPGPLITQSCLWDSSNEQIVQRFCLPLWGSSSATLTSALWHVGSQLQQPNSHVSSPAPQSRPAHLFLVLWGEPRSPCPSSLFWSLQLEWSPPLSESRRYLNFFDSPPLYGPWLILGCVYMSVCVSLARLALTWHFHIAPHPQS